MNLRASLALALLPALLLEAGACGKRLTPSYRPNKAVAGSSDTPAAGGDRAPKSKATDAHAGVDALFPEEQKGWEMIDEATKVQIDSFSRDYLDFLSTATTQRASASAIVERALSAGALPFDGSGKHKAGELLLWQDAASSSIALLRIGERPIQEGLHVLLASTDAAVIRLTPNPSYQKSGLALFDTTILGKLKLERWLNTPLALHVHVAAASGEAKKTIVIGDDADEPVFTIPDLLPHLSRKVQKKGLIDSPERLDALAALDLSALAKGLQKYGIRQGDWNRAEAELLPVSAAGYIGVDRALIASPRHAARAPAFAAIRALLENTGKHTSLVILMGHSKRSYAGADAEAHITNLLPLAIAQQSENLDALDLRRIYARSRVLLFDNHSGKRNRGVVLNSRKDDSTPEAFRYALQSFEGKGLQLQIVEDSGWSEAREVASLDMDAIEIGLPIEGVGTPSALLSTLDLYQAFLACQAWLTQ